VAIAALVVVDGHRIIGLMATDTERSVEDIAKTGGRVVDMEMGVRRRLVPMAGEAVDCGLVGVGDNHLHRGADWRRRVDVTGGVVTGAATTEMGGQDVRPVEDRVTVGAGLRVCLGTIGGRVELDGMVDQAAGGAMVMGREGSAMAGDALAATSNGRGDETAVGHGVVAGDAPFGSMNLANTDEW